MKIRFFKNKAPDEAKRIRNEVFVKEQGFHDEFDEKDAVSVHFVMYTDDGIAVATSRTFPFDENASYCIGRIAVIKEMRNQKLGSKIVEAAEGYIKSIGGKTAIIHAQKRAEGFYRAIGYTVFGDEDTEEGCPHVWMKKSLQ